MLIARTKSNPEEFDCFDTNKKKGRWNWVIDAVYDRTIRWDVSSKMKDLPLPFLDHEEVEDLYRAIAGVQGQAFTKRVMAELLAADEGRLSMARAIHGTEVGGSLGVLVQHYQLGEKGTEVVNALGKRRADFTDEELARYASYCINDVDLTYELFKCLAGDFPIPELELIDLTIRMFTEPVLKLDKTVLANHLVEIRSSKDMLLRNITENKEELMSNPKFAEILRKCGVEPPMKISPTTNKDTYAFSKTDEEFKALLEHENVNVQAVVAARLGMRSTIEETRTERFIEIGQRGLLPIPLRYYAAHTGRWGGDDKVNMQNLPRSSPLKNAIVAPDGYFIVDSDSSQIEARTLAWLAEQNDLVEAFDKGEDVYKIMASAIYGKPQEEITKDERFVGKTTILGAGYGMGPVKFKAQLKRLTLTYQKKNANASSQSIEKPTPASRNSGSKQVVRYWQLPMNKLPRSGERGLWLWRVLRGLGCRTVFTSSTRTYGVGLTTKEKKNLSTIPRRVKQLSPTVSTAAR
jgi:hypothetical protein